MTLSRGPLWAIPPWSLRRSSGTGTASGTCLPTGRSDMGYGPGGCGTVGSCLGCDRHGSRGAARYRHCRQHHGSLWRRHVGGRSRRQPCLPGDHRLQQHIPVERRREGRFHRSHRGHGALHRHDSKGRTVWLTNRTFILDTFNPGGSPTDTRAVEVAVALNTSGVLVVTLGQSTSGAALDKVYGVSVSGAGGGGGGSGDDAFDWATVGNSDQIPVVKMGTGLALSTTFLQGNGAWGQAAISWAQPGNSNVIPVAKLGGGTPSSTKYLRGDGSWQTPPSGGMGSGDDAFDWATVGNADRIPVAKLGSGTASASTVLHGNGAWGSVDGLPTALHLTFGTNRDLIVAINRSGGLSQLTQTINIPGGTGGTSWDAENSRDATTGFVRAGQGIHVHRTTDPNGKLIISSLRTADRSPVLLSLHDGWHGLHHQHAGPCAVIPGSADQPTDVHSGRCSPGRGLHLCP